MMPTPPSSVRTNFSSEWSNSPPTLDHLISIDPRHSALSLIDMDRMIPLDQRISPDLKESEWLQNIDGRILWRGEPICKYRYLLRIFVSNLNLLQRDQTWTALDSVILSWVFSPESILLRREIYDRDLVFTVKVEAPEVAASVIGSLENVLFGMNFFKVSQHTYPHDDYYISKSEWTI
jgi:hypothetical protein